MMPAEESDTMSAYIPPSEEESSGDEVEGTSVRRRHVWNRNARSVEPPRDDAIYYPQDDTFGLFDQGRDYEPLNITHKYTDEERKTLGTYDSHDYLPSNSEVYRKWLKLQGPSSYNLGRWLIMGLIGFFVGLIGFLLHDLIEQIAKMKWEIAQKFIKDGDFGVASVFATGYSLIFILFSAFIVVFLRPSASGSGIPEVTGFLNGTQIRHIFNVKTLLVKFFSCVAAVGCGLPVGPEGPMIHMGALVGAGLSQFRSETLGINLPFFRRYRTSEDRRNFISAGAAAGVASAFGAPVGGLLFSMEEVSSFWTVTLSWQIFFCCMVSAFTTDLFNSAFDGFSYTGNFGQFKTQRYILFNIDKGIDVNILMFIPTVIIGVIGGLLGAIFTILNLKMTRGRKKLLSTISEHTILQKLLRIFEPAVIMIIITLLAVFLPAVFPCSRYTCKEGATGATSVNCLNDTRNPLHVEGSVVKYTCFEGQTWKDDQYTWKTNGTYNEMATLMFGTLENAVKHLFSRDTHLQFGFASLLSTLVIYFIMICWATGTSVSCGALVPMLLVGGLYGRLIGILMTTMFGVHSGENLSYWAWMDPGVFALIGAASFFGGVTRLNLAVTVIMMELTNDVQVLLPVMVSVMISKWVGDFFTHPVYHALMELKCIPFLDPEPRVTIEKNRLNLELYLARHVMSSPVISIRTKSSVLDLAKLLLETSHGGFPVVKVIERSGDEVFQGMITRLELSVLLRHEELFESDGSMEDSGDSGSGEADPSCLEYEQMNILKLKNPREISRTLQNYTKNSMYKTKYLNLKSYINQSSLSIPERFSLHRTYIIFRTLGLRHMAVVDTSNKVLGIITRKDLMGFNIVEKVSTLHDARCRPHVRSRPIN
ncbi:chloride channel protein C-like isoform X2 [Mizuhopecten yessoensis]|uniref:chloride channel protein C-like isoform X2 n=1 Tax=Mizuhopecten yessoensis TaxID=6573 RepID=UPI000B45963B|nr:chloride channel protein C-like isoform X2 [Mizuhopecten yessoensis]